MNRSEVLGLLRELPAAPAATRDEALPFIERNRPMGRGIGYIAVPLLASALPGDDLQLWTADVRLASAAARPSVTYDPTRRAL